MKTSVTAIFAALSALTTAAPAPNDYDHIRRTNDLGHHVYARAAAPCNNPTPFATGTAASIPLSTGTAPSIPMVTATSTSPCLVDGAVVCNGMEYFGLCNRGSVVWQRVAEGMGCLDGRVVGVGEYAGMHMAT